MKIALIICYSGVIFIYRIDRLVIHNSFNTSSAIVYQLKAKKVNKQENMSDENLITLILMNDTAYVWNSDGK